MKFKTKIVTLFLISFSLGMFAQKSHKGNVHVDKNGVMRWENGDEVKGFGVNYTAPFAHAYRTAGKFGVDIKKSIDNDTYHFARLGFDLYRIHVWDTEISDTLGNLLENKHLDAFDYLLKKLKDRNINFVLTPIAYWGNGWPEPDEDTPGFSHKYGKAAGITNPADIKAEKNYLKQFLNHVNPYTGVAYKNEPNLIGIEISNEPHHRGTPQEVTSFVKGMLEAVKNTGFKKPVFYNTSHAVYMEGAYFNAGIDGGTFQWYPTGLGFGKELEGNLLPNVNKYNIPFDSIIQQHHAAKIVYEFDAADVNKSYIYPAMARSFRQAGIQIATHFAYDPTFMAFANTEYNDHYMNLAYAPTKALSLMIVSKIFHTVPRYKDFGPYPQNTSFGNFKVNYKNDLATYNSEEEFIYTNSNSETPKNEKKLGKIAGYGNSEVVKYKGLGAYFLDKINKGMWRLEVMPDAVLVNDPFGRNNFEKNISVINWKKWPMQLNLPDLGSDFSIIPLNEGNEYTTSASSAKFGIQPGAYLLKEKGISKKIDKDQKLGNFSLNEFTAPKSNLDKTYVVHQPYSEIDESGEYEIRSTIISPDSIEKVSVVFNNGRNFANVAMENDSAYSYTAKIPEKVLTPGYLEYRIVISTPQGKSVFPGNFKTDPFAWDNYHSERYITAVVPAADAVYLFNAKTDTDKIVGQWKPDNKNVPLSPTEAEYQVHLEKLFTVDPENINTKPVYDYSFRYNFEQKVKGRESDLSAKTKLVFKAESLSNHPEKIQLAIVNAKGYSFGKIVEVSPGINEYSVNISDLKPVKTVSLPRPYPSFLPYYFEHPDDGSLEITSAEAVQFSIGPGIEEENYQKPHEIGIISLRLE